MTAIISTAYSRYLGDELRRLRESCTSFTGRGMAIHLGWDPSKVSNIENGKARASEIDLVQFLATCGKDIRYVEDFRDRYRKAFDPCFAPRADNLRTLVMAEAMAEKIFSFEILNVHGLLQTRDYARALFIDVAIEVPEDIERHVQTRIERQTVLRRVDRPECVFFVHEFALRTRWGGEQELREQYRRLLHRTHSLRVVPASVSTFRSSLALFEFDKAPSAVFTETDMLQLWAQDDEAVSRAKAAFHRLHTVALDEDQSRDKVLEHMDRLPETGAT
ncbi:Helix-turn-helix domain-containing protein [Lentzea fradiae]|uniref:Helix-turn-helix domain-containing protein n=1 Tax=Lentzea fradiae TaxID=200378 RepID=A0A1G7SPE7_9PSEU|nr:helix-turn-helix transcriptional regulator [Lentzea fradiae]SDG24309.1 Helix-turn-helix domain-containing protein [Lentzea fradiae]